MVSLSVQVEVEFSVIIKSKVLIRVETARRWSVG